MIEFGTPFKTAAVRRERSNLERAGRNGFPVVEIVQHRRMPRRRQQQILEMTEHVRPDGVALIASDQHMLQILNLRKVKVLTLIHIEVVEPEIDQHFFQLPVGIQRAKNLGFLEILASDRTRRALPLSFAAKLGKRRQTLGRKRASYLCSPLRIQVGEQRRHLILISGPRDAHLIGIQKVLQLWVAEAIVLLELLLLSSAGVFQ